jgi:hypothetical protein
MRKDLTLDRRSSDDAEGERRMMGSGRRPLDGFAGRMAGAGVMRAGVGAEALERPKKASAYLRTCEKSYRTELVQLLSEAKRIVDVQ